MGRAVLVELLLFLLPFAAFGLYLAARRRSLIAASSWSQEALWLVLAGLVLAVGGLVYTGLVAERHQGPFVPTHLENGRLVPGEFK